MGMFGRSDGTVTTAFVAKDMMTAPMRGMRASMDRFRADARTGFGLAAGIGVFKLGTQALGSLVDFMGDAARAAMEDERSVAQLTATLKANVTAWDGSTDAIEDQIAAAEDLAFADDDVRAGLGRLVTVTKDVNEALRLNRLAMDLARARGMALEEAAGLVAKVYNGQVGALRRAGVAIGDVKDRTAALAILQKTVAGQADAYATTTEGQFAAMRIALDEVNEDIGRALLPAMLEVARFIRTDVVPVVTDLVELAGDFGEVLDELRRSVDDEYAAFADFKLQAYEVGEALGATREQVDQVVASLQRGAVFKEWIRDSATVALLIDALRGELQDLIAAGGGLPDLVETFRYPFRAAVEHAEDSLGALEGIVKGSLREAAQEARIGMADITWTLTHPTKEEDLEAIYRRAVRRGTRAMNQALAEGNAAAYAKASAFVRRYKAKLAELEQQSFHVQVQMDFVTLTGGIPGLGSGVHYQDPDATILGPRTRPRRRNRPRGRRHGGGSAAPHGTYLVGEDGPELLEMGSRSGRVVPDAGRGTAPIVVNIDGHELFRIVDGRQGRQLALNGSF